VLSNQSDKTFPNLGLHLQLDQAFVDKLKGRLAGDKAVLVEGLGERQVFEKVVCFPLRVVSLRVDVTQERVEVFEGQRTERDGGRRTRVIA